MSITPAVAAYGEAWVSFSMPGMPNRCDGIAAVAFAPNGLQFASAEAHRTESGTAHEIVLRDAATGAPLRTLTGSPDAVTALAYSPKGGLLASGSRDGTIRMWRLTGR